VLGLQSDHPVLVLVGGAGKMDRRDGQSLQTFFLEKLAPLAVALGATVVDGGTNAGIMQLMGQARARISASFPLIGVVVAEKVVIPVDFSTQRTQLEPHHTHFVLVPGVQWGDESLWMSHVAHVLSASAASVTILVNGGETAWKDVEISVAAGRPVIIVEGSGRTADVLAKALRGEVSDERAQGILASHLLRVANVKQDYNTFAHTVEAALAPREDEHKEI
jgi:SLOG in TRPM, prokaryote